MYVGGGVWAVAYTQADLDSIKTAIVKLATGDRVVRVTLSSGLSTEYAQANLKDLESLAATVQAEIDSASDTKRRYFVTTFRKGL